MPTKAEKRARAAKADNGHWKLRAEAAAYPGERILTAAEAARIWAIRKKVAELHMLMDTPLAMPNYFDTRCSARAVDRLEEAGMWAIKAVAGRFKPS